MSIFSDMESTIRSGKKLFFLLIDPDKVTFTGLELLLGNDHAGLPDLILVGGSIISRPLDPVVEKIKNISSLPVFLFPGSLLQFSGKADGILMISLISGRNPEYLIGNHVTVAPLIKHYGLEVIPAGYILIGGNVSTSVEIVSHSHPLPAQKSDIIVATALAGEYTGNRMIYLEKGSGADSPVPVSVVKKVKNEITVPLIVGGGIKTIKQATELYRAGADVLVVGNAIESHPEFLTKLRDLADKM